MKTASGLEEKSALRSLWDLLLQAKLIVGVIVALLVGSFGVGVYTSNASNAKAIGELEKKLKTEEHRASNLESELRATEAGLQATIASLNADIDKHKRALGDYRALRNKELFLSRYLLYLLAENNLEKENSEEARAEYEAASLSLMEYLELVLDRNMNQSEESTEVISIGKGATHPTITFLGDEETVWILPGWLKSLDKSQN